MITENLSTLKIHKLTQVQYERELAANNIDKSAMYLTPDEEIDLSKYATKDELNTELDKKAPAKLVTHNKVATAESGIDGAIDDVWNSMANYSSTVIVLAVTKNNLSLLAGKWHITINKYSDDEGSLTAVKDNYYGVDIMRRSRYQGTWQPWEWDNPPMNVDTEYRTTERWNGKAVYTQLVNMGMCPNNAETSIEFPYCVIRCSGWCDAGNNLSFTIPYDVGAQRIKCHHVAGELIVHTDFDASDYNAYIQAWYTKD